MIFGSLKVWLVVYEFSCYTFWLSSRHFLQGEIYCYTNFYCYANLSIVRLIFLLFSDQISGGFKSRGGGGKLPQGAPLWKKGSITSSYQTYLLVPSKLIQRFFLLSFLFSDWLSSNHLKSRIEGGFWTCFRAMFVVP